MTSKKSGKISLWEHSEISPIARIFGLAVYVIAFCKKQVAGEELAQTFSVFFMVNMQQN